MSAKTSRIIRELTESVKKASTPRTQPYDTQATVTRIEDGVAWVHIPGGVTETPVKLTINAAVGDTVQVRVSGGRAFLVGNSTAPPTDDKLAKTVQKDLGVTNKLVSAVKKVAERASKIATSMNQYFWVVESGTSDNGVHITQVPQEDFQADPENGGGNLLATSNGIAVRDGLTELATFGASGSRIGSADSDFSIVQESDRLAFEWDGIRCGEIIGEVTSIEMLHTMTGQHLTISLDNGFSLLNSSGDGIRIKNGDLNVMGGTYKKDGQDFIAVESKALSSVTLSASGGTDTATGNVSKTGYTPICIVAIAKSGSGSGQAALSGYYISGTTANVSYVNVSTSSRTVGTTVTILYTKS